MPRTLKITMEIEIDHLPADEIDDIEDFASDEDITLDEAAASILADATDDEVAACIQQACLDLEIFAGSCLYLKVLEANVTSAAWAGDAVVTSQQGKTPEWQQIAYDAVRGTS